EVADVVRLPYNDDSFDLVTASQVLHHLTDDDASRALNEMARVSRSMLVISDLHRNRLAWLGIHAVTRVLACGPMIKADGPLSVRKGFVRADLQAMAAELGHKASMSCQIGWQPMFRWGLVATHSHQT